MTRLQNNWIILNLHCVSSLDIEKGKTKCQCSTYPSILSAEWLMKWIAWLIWRSKTRDSWCWPSLNCLELLPGLYKPFFDLVISKFADISSQICSSEVKEHVWMSSVTAVMSLPLFLCLIWGDAEQFSENKSSSQIVLLSVPTVWPLNRGQAHFNKGKSSCYFHSCPEFAWPVIQTA